MSKEFKYTQDVQTKACIWSISKFNINFRLYQKLVSHAILLS